MPTLHLLIKGKVQGVFYRATAKEIANELGITGWIKNTNEGDVEAVVTGSQDQLQAFATWCRTGPERANVSEVISEEVKEEKFKDFSVIRQRV
ncbi:acylphosphatase [Segetibacter aerophilus]|uniref:acylphosphatase n=1 Tax=Segetibacter aerophilus TaxID=670293 RepID=A0A512BI92_9BACT|nr:acylphosphatase [Segetibacter aerophilus]GEO11694.1 acylphosphatase [Segetibacter aerophilus]